MNLQMENVRRMKKVENMFRNVFATAIFATPKIMMKTTELEGFYLNFQWFWFHCVFIIHCKVDDLEYVKGIKQFGLIHFLPRFKPVHYHYILDFEFEYIRLVEI